MAKPDDGVAALERLESIENLWDGSKEYCGEQSDLIAAGVALAAWFPDGERDWKASRTIADYRGRKVQLYRRPSGSFRVIHRASSVESAAARKRHFEEKERAQCAKHARRELERLPHTEQEFRRLAQDLTDRLGYFIWTTLGEDRGGFSFTPDAFEDIAAAISELREAVRAAAVRFSSRQRADEHVSIQARALGVSPAFERFMARAINEKPSP